MDLRIGLLGTGQIGQAHIVRINEKLKGGLVVAVYDHNQAFGKIISERFDLRYFEHYSGLIASPDVDAIIITASDDFHEEYVLESIKNRKFVFCEKPLAPRSEACKRIVDAEILGGKQLVQVGFMRRFDSGYRKLKNLLDERAFGEPLMVHCQHRNTSIGNDFTTPMVVENSMIHEIDVLRWLLGEDYTSAQMILPKKASNATEKLHDPQMLILSTKSGIHVDIESFMRSGFGYDIKCEICCDNGSISLPEPAFPLVKADFKKSMAIPSDWKVRFTEAYDLELQEWIHATKEGIVAGPTAWDGYVASITTAAASKARETGSIVKIENEACPSFYKKG